MFPSGFWTLAFGRLSLSRWAPLVHDESDQASDIESHWCNLKTGILSTNSVQPTQLVGTSKVRPRASRSSSQGEGRRATDKSQREALQTGRLEGNGLGDRARFQNSSSRSSFHAGVVPHSSSIREEFAQIDYLCDFLHCCIAGSLTSLMEGASRSRRPPSSRSTQACGSTPRRRSLVGLVGGARQ